MFTLTYFVANASHVYSQTALHLWDFFRGYFSGGQNAMPTDKQINRVSATRSRLYLRRNHRDVWQTETTPFWYSFGV